MQSRQKQGQQTSSKRGYRKSQAQPPSSSISSGRCDQGREPRKSQHLQEKKRHATKQYRRNGVGRGGWENGADIQRYSVAPVLHIDDALVVASLLPRAIRQRAGRLMRRRPRVQCQHVVSARCFVSSLFCFPNEPWILAFQQTSLHVFDFVKYFEVLATFDGGLRSRAPVGR